MDQLIDSENNYRVEVSGWDRAENFFVEKTVLDWGHVEKKEVGLRADIREGAIVFVRLLQSAASGNNFPIAYQVKTASSRESDGRIYVTLEQLRPRFGSACRTQQNTSASGEFVLVA